MAAENPSVQDFLKMPPDQRTLVLERVAVQNKELRRKILTVVPEVTRPSLSFVFQQMEMLDTHTYDTPEDQGAKDSATRTLNELMNMYNSEDPFMNILADRSQLAGFFEQMLNISPYFRTQNSLNAASYPTDFRSFMRWRDMRMGFDE